MLTTLRRCHPGSGVLSCRGFLNMSSKSKKEVYPAAERNKEPILKTLRGFIKPKKDGKFLEISSGSGQHVAHIAPSFDSIEFQPTEFERSLFPSINSYSAESENIREAQFLDVTSPPSTWLGGSKQGTYDYIYNANMMHISEWACSVGLFNGAGYLLKPGGLLFTYGPYSVNGVISPESNIQFDASLRSRNPTWGLRDIYKELVPLAESNNITLTSVNDLPANNKLLVWTKK